MLFALVLLCPELYSQDRIDNFFSLVLSPNRDKIEHTILTKTDTGVERKDELQYNYILPKGELKWRGPQVDSMDIIDYKRDTVYIISTYNSFFPSGEQLFIIITDKGRITAQRKDRISVVKPYTIAGREASDYIYSYDHPVVVDAVAKWDMDELSRIVSLFGIPPGTTIEGDPYEYAWRIIIEDYKKVKTSVVQLTPLYIIDRGNGPRPYLFIAN